VAASFDPATGAAPLGRALFAVPPVRCARFRALPLLAAPSSELGTRAVCVCVCACACGLCVCFKCALEWLVCFKFARVPRSLLATPFVTRTTDLFEGCVPRPMAVVNASLTPLLAGPKAVLDAI
jgi:hypothetical protein